MRWAAFQQAHVEGWAREWELSVPEERALLLAAAECMRASKKKKAGPADGYRLTLKALASYEVRPASCSRLPLWEHAAASATLRSLL